MPSRKSKLFPDLKPSNTDERFMLEAVKEAEKAIELGVKIISEEDFIEMIKKG